MTYKVGDKIEFDYMNGKLEREIQSIGSDGTLYVDIDDHGDLSWAVHPSMARRLFGMGATAEEEEEEGNTEEPEDPVIRRGAPREAENPPEAGKYVDLDTYAKVATVVIFGGLILGHM